MNDHDLAFDGGRGEAPFGTSHRRSHAPLGTSQRRRDAPLGTSQGRSDALRDALRHCRRVAAVALSTLVALLAAAGCADDDPSAGAGAAPTISTQTTLTVSVPGDGGVVQAFVRDEATPVQVEHLRTALAKLSDAGAISEYRFRSKEEALADLRGRLDDPTILDNLPANPLPDSFEITTPTQRDAEAVEAAIRDDPAIDPELGVMSGPERPSGADLEPILVPVVPGTTAPTAPVVP